MIRPRYEAWNSYFGIGAQGAADRRRREAQRKAREAAAARAAAAAAATAPPKPPDRTAIDKLFPDYPKRTEPQWQDLLNARVKPFEDALTKAQTAELGRSEFQFEQAQAANQGLSVAFTKLLTGGKEGAEAEQYAKENFGGQYLPAQAMSLAHTQLGKLTSDWNDREWEISTRYQKAFAEVPGLREEIRASVERGDGDEYTRRFNYANLLLDEAWNVYDANAKQYNTEQQLKAAEDAIRKEQSSKGYPTRKEAVAEAAKWADDTGTIWTVVQNQDGSWSAKDTKKKKPGSSSTAATEIKWRNAALREASDMTKATGTVWKAQKVNGVWTAVSTGKKKVGTGKGAKVSSAQEAENKLMLEIYSDRDKYVQKPNPAYVDDKTVPRFIGGMTYIQAYQQLLDVAYATLQPYGRSRTYVANWVRQRLANLYPGQSAANAKPRGG